VLAIESSILIFAGALLCRFLSSAVWQRTIWQAVNVALGVLLLSEVSGVGPAVAGLAAVRHSTGVSGTRKLEVVVNAPEVRPAANEAVSDQPAGGDQSTVSVTFNTSWWPGLIWLIGAAVLVMRVALARIVFALLGRYRRPLSDPLLVQEAQKLATALQWKRRLRLMQCSRLSSPIAYGWVRSTICLPENFTAEFTPAQQQAMLAHEMAHLAARDPIWYSISDLLTALWWWQPLAWWSRRRFQSASERCADDASTVVEDGPGALAESLLVLGKRFRPLHSFWALRIEGNGFRSEIGRRVMRLLDPEPYRMRTGPVAAWQTRMTAVIVALAISSLLAMANLNSDSHHPKSAWTESLAARAWTTFRLEEPVAAGNHEPNDKALKPGSIAQLATAVARFGLNATAVPPVIGEPVVDSKAELANPSTQKSELRTRSFKVDPNTFAESLQRVRVQPSGRHPEDRKLLEPADGPKTSEETFERIRDLLVRGGVDLTPPKAVFYNDRTGILMVRATVEDLAFVEQMLQMLNAAPPQLTIDIKWVEVTESAGNATDFIALLGLGTDGKPYVPRTIDPTAGLPSVASEALATNSPLFTGILTAKQYKAAIRALEQRDGVDLLSSPRVTTLSGRQAQIKVVDVRSIVTDSESGVDGKEHMVTKQMEFGPTLDIVPVVNADGYTIQLTAIPTLREFLGYDEKGAKLQQVGKQGAPVALPIFRERKMVGSAVVRDGQTMVIGPGAVEVVDETRPKGGTKIRKSLFVLITPTIIDPAGNRVHNAE